MRNSLLTAGAVLTAVCGPMTFSNAALGRETCFHSCLKTKLVSPTIDDQTIRDNMQMCKTNCDQKQKAQLESEGTAAKVAACVPEILDEKDLKRVRSASPSVVAYANTFTWDVENVLPDKVIRRVEITTQNLSLEDITMSAGGIVEPGQKETFLMKNVADGYPSMRVTTRIKAIYACDFVPVPGPDTATLPRQGSAQ